MKKRINEILAEHGKCLIDLIEDEGYVKVVIADAEDVKNNNELNTFARNVYSHEKGLSQHVFYNEWGISDIRDAGAEPMMSYMHNLHRDIYSLFPEGVSEFTVETRWHSNLMDEDGTSFIISDIRSMLTLNQGPIAFKGYSVRLKSRFSGKDVEVFSILLNDDKKILASTNVGKVNLEQLIKESEDWYQICQWAETEFTANRSFESIIAFYDAYGGEDEFRIQSVTTEMVRKSLSRMLMNTDKSKTYACSFALESDKTVGMSSLDMPWVEGMWQDEITGDIWFKMDYSGGRLHFDDLSISEILCVANAVK